MCVSDNDVTYKYTTVNFISWVDQTYTLMTECKRPGEFVFDGICENKSCISNRKLRFTPVTGNVCQKRCEYVSDRYTLQCVEKCPSFFVKITSGGRDNSILFPDDSTLKYVHLCVSTCP